MAFCIKCGNELPDEAVFCNKCGQKMPVTEEKSAQPEEASATAQEEAGEIHFENTNEQSPHTGDSSSANEDGKEKKKEPNRTLVSFFMPYMGVYYFIRNCKTDKNKAMSCLISASISCVAVFLTGLTIWMMEGRGDGFTGLMVLVRLIFIITLPIGALIGAFMLAEKPSNEYSTASSLKSNGEIFDGFIRHEDDMTGYCKFEHPKGRGTMGAAFGLNAKLWPYFISYNENNKFIIKLRYCITYGGASRHSDWAFINTLIFKTDNERYTINVSPRRENETSYMGNTLWSTYYESGNFDIKTENDFKFFRDIACSKTLKVRFHGSKSFYDFNFDSMQARRIIIDAYNACINSSGHMAFPIVVEQK